MSYKIGVIGVGYVGLVTGTCFAATGNDVWCVDIISQKIEMLKQGKSPIFEPGLERLIQQNLEQNRLHFTTDLQETVKNTELIFLCLPTPPQEDGSADLQHVLKVTEDIANILKENDIRDRKIIVTKSTVPVGTADKVRAIFDSILPGGKHLFASNPEFLREGFAVEDSMNPERVILGTESEEVEKVMRDVYHPFLQGQNPLIVMDVRSAEITKYAANSFLATKISFMNDLSAYCEAIGANIDKIRQGIGSDSRIGKRFLFAGLGYGGSCLPKDVKALIHSTDEAGTELGVIKAAHDINEKQQQRFIGRIIKRFSGDIAGRTFALWGLAFKPNTDDTREAPSFRIIERLLSEEANIKSYDPEAVENTKFRFGEEIEYSQSMYDAAERADALIIATEWKVFRNPDFERLQDKLKNKIIFDGRNLYNLEEMENRGFEYYSIGRNFINSKL